MKRSKFLTCAAPILLSVLVMPYTDSAAADLAKAEAEAAKSASASRTDSESATGAKPSADQMKATHVNTLVNPLLGTREEHPKSSKPASAGGSEPAAPTAGSVEAATAPPAPDKSKDSPQQAEAKKAPSGSASEGLSFERLSTIAEAVNGAVIVERASSPTENAADGPTREGAQLLNNGKAVPFGILNTDSNGLSGRSAEEIAGYRATLSKGVGSDDSGTTSLNNAIENARFRTRGSAPVLGASSIGASAASIATGRAVSTAGNSDNQPTHSVSLRSRRPRTAPSSGSFASGSGYSGDGGGDNNPVESAAELAAAAGEAFVPTAPEVW